MIGIIGLGYVGKAVSQAFRCRQIISDPRYNNNQVIDVTQASPEAIFVCVPTPENDQFSILLNVLDQIQSTDYTGVVVVKSTVLPEYIKDRDVVCNPEFLTQRTASQDFIKPHVMVIGGDREPANKLLQLYKAYTDVCVDNCHITDKHTACMIKYTMNCFYAVKVWFMNTMHEHAEQLDHETYKRVLKSHPWMGTHHYDVPGPDGQKGFGGACLPKDLSTFAEHHNIPILKSILKDNQRQRIS